MSAEDTSSACSFRRWRPQFHLLAPSNWLNDPCGPGYDPSTGRYHIAYQWNPKDNDWGDICWGRATSTDLVSWETDPEPCLVPFAPYDNKGIFTGCFQPTTLQSQQDGTLIYFYTSVNKLPIHYTLPYSTGCETLSIALSRDAGRTWARYENNPILPGPPSGLQVYAWRDPYVFSWPFAPDNVRRASEKIGEDVLYGLISGGLRDQTPTVFVYAIDRKALAEWKYIDILSDVGLNCTPSRWSGDLGVNWEVANLATLTDTEGTSRDFLIMGVEGCIPSTKKEKQPNARDRRIQRSQLWMCAKGNRDPSSKALTEYSFSGVFDSGLFYAANSFWDPISQQQIVFGWITEEDLPDDVRKKQGWSGLISLPRVLNLQTLHGVKRARSTASLREITSIEAVSDDTGRYTVHTLGIKLDSRVERLRKGATHITRSNLPLGASGDSSEATTSQRHIPLSTTRWEIDAEIAVGRNCGQVGLVIFHDSDHSSKTTLFWNPLSETFQVNRPALPNTRINHDPEITPHTLFTYTNLEDKDSETETEEEEPLHIHAIFDRSVLEIFVNERTAITTRIYQSSTEGSPTCVGMEFFAELIERNGGEEPARLLYASVWDGLSQIQI
ncbi:glycosyl hydrolase [Aspergillus karnatakaensis]|uniref:glycoside hydrolase family 32 protein n=1 Tax=Aspergillus karnatakaensis TaxID=1810916 RepID=UPI003CCCFEA2